MFIGEMGCWLVIATYAVINRLFSRGTTSRGEYAPISTAADGSVVETNGDIVHQDTPSSPSILKALLPDGDTRTPLTGARIFLLAIPACCDIAGTTLMNVGLLFVAASIYQMTRGALVLFVGLFSVIFLRRRLVLYQWISLIIVVLGVAIVGLAGVIATSSSSAPSSNVPSPAELKAASMLILRELHAAARTPEAIRTIVGVLLIAGAQVFTATQFVVEEWILEHYALEPLKVVGWEGIFGFSVTLVGMLILHLLIGRTKAGQYGYFDAREGWREITEYRAIAFSSVLIMISIG